MTLDLSGPVTSVCRGEGAANCAIHGPEAQPTHVPPSHGEHIWICSHLKHIFSTFAVVTLQQVPHGKNTTTPTTTTTTTGGRANEVLHKSSIESQSVSQQWVHFYLHASQHMRDSCVDHCREILWGVFHSCSWLQKSCTFL